MKISIKTFQQLFKISMVELDELDKAIALVMCLTGKSEFEINKMSPLKFNKLCLKIKSAFDRVNTDVINSKPKNIVKANGNWYYLNYEITKEPMNAGRYVDIATFNNDLIGNLHLIMASMANPMKWTWKGLELQEYNALDHERIANDMLELDFIVAYNSALFFWAVFMKSIESLKDYSVTEQSKNLKATMLLRSLQNILVGSITPRWFRTLKILN